MMNDATDRPRDLYGLVLAGGRSRRFGSDKAAIEVDGQSLLERTADLLRPVVRRVYVSATENQSEDPLRGAFALILDEEPGLGPAGGLRAAHRLHPEAAWLVVACDMPALDERVVARLVQSRGPEKAATAFRSPVDGHAEPLCAIYEPVTLARFARQAAMGQGLSPRRLLLDSDVRLVELPVPGALRNVNTPDDLGRGD